MAHWPMEWVSRDKKRRDIDNDEKEHDKTKFEEVGFKSWRFSSDLFSWYRILSEKNYIRIVCR